jgi:integrase
VSLELGDIDWATGQIRVRGKNGQRNDLPLPADVGEAIADYLRKWRPRNASHRVFLRDKAPIRGFKGPSGLGCVVRRSLKRAGESHMSIDGEIRSISAMLESRFVCAVSRSGLGLFSLWICGMQVEATNFHMR